MISLCGLALLQVIVGAQGNPLQWFSAAPQEEKPTFSVTQQNPDICDAGSRQWTGTVTVTEEKSMFFWYFESRNQPEDAPVILWMSGQPIGVGFSKVESRDKMAKNIHEAAQELEKFLSVFVSQVFPELASKPWHFAGESFGGHYVTYYLHHLLNEKPHETPLLNVSSAIIVDGYIDATRQSAGYYDFFCQDWRDDGSKPLMSTRECDEMASYVPECERLGELCRQTVDVEVCHLAAKRCEWTVGKHFLENVKPGGWNPYDSRKPCVEPPICSDLDGGAALQFLNRPWVQERLGFSDVSFELIDFDFNRRWDAEGTLYLPTTKQLTWLLDETNIHVLFINGNNDIIITPGQMRLLDEQPWSRQAWYRAQRYSNWYVEDGELSSNLDSKKARQGGTWKGDKRLALFTVDEAGHTCPFDQSEAVGAVIKNWIRLDSVEGNLPRTDTKVDNEL
ncbi:carboxypeptidase Y [Fusarium mundagurra]|uniref:carboxypeptidase C n=1 Tax=Fusarium mundagurra TaxID=1567541 RepID=A0A8H5YHY0_9HYPO|nr:carboxypeptidase Y [Fusarium mundagurra]